MPHRQRATSERGKLRPSGGEAASEGWVWGQPLVSGVLPGLRGREGGHSEGICCLSWGTVGCLMPQRPSPTPLRLTFMGRLEPRYTTKMATACHQW